MSIRPFRDINRKKTKEINVGDLKIGGDNPISVQSMTNTLTKDVKSTVKQIIEIENAGADLVRVSCPDKESTEALKQILKEVKVVYLNKPENIFNSFKKAYEDKKSYSYLFVEHGDFYNDK